MTDRERSSKETTRRMADQMVKLTRMRNLCKLAGEEMSEALRNSAERLSYEEIDTDTHIGDVLDASWAWADRIRNAVDELGERPTSAA